MKKMSPEYILLTLKKLNSEYQFWIRSSGIVSLIILIIIYKWNDISYYNSEWIVASLGILLTSAWWFWVMRTVKLMLTYRQTEIEQLIEAGKAINDIKNDFNKL
jgi:hypothetical protein